MQLPKVQQLGLGHIADPARSAMTCTVLLARAANAAPVELAGAIVHDRERQRPANGRAAGRPPPRQRPLFLPLFDATTQAA